MSIASEIAGLIAVILCVVAIQFKDKTKLLFLQTLTNIFKVLSLVFVSAFAGAYSQFVGLLRKFWFFKNSRKHHKNKITSLVFFLALEIVVAAFTWEGLITVLPILGIWLGTYAIWQDDPYILRYFSFLGALSFAIYGILNSTVMNTLSEVFEMVSVVVSLIRFHYEGKKQKSLENAKIETITD
ncbi:MAG: YgjV family protein [Spirochaetales bacterium]